MNGSGDSPNYQRSADNIVAGNMFHGMAMAALCTEREPFSKQEAEEILQHMSCAMSHFEAALELRTKPQ